MKADGERLRMEREAMEGFVSPESHSNVKKQLMDMKVYKLTSLQAYKLNIKKSNSKIKMFRLDNGSLQLPSPRWRSFFLTDEDPVLNPVY